MTLESFTPEPGIATRPYVVEYYYKVGWGDAGEFLALFLKNHHPVLVRQLQTGRVTAVRIEQPRYHAPEADRWDYRVTVTYASVAAEMDKSHEPRLILEMYPDQDTFRKEEARRFELLLAHWDVPVVDITP